MIDSSSILYNKVSGDENYTPEYAVLPIVEYIPPESIIWCPFDTQNSNYVQILQRTNRVVFGHINSGDDFFEYEPMHWDILVSNPPFQNKRKFFERAIGFGKPFALLMTNTWLNDSAPKQLFSSIDLELLMFDKRIKYFNNEGRPNNKITFSSSYYCNGILPKQIIMKELAPYITATGGM